MMKRICSALALVTLFLSSLPAVSAPMDPITNIPEIGKHYRPLIIEKSYNRHNVLSAYTKLDENCRLVTDRGNRNTPILDFYWLNNRTSYEALDSSIGSVIKDRLRVEPNGSRDQISVALTDLKTLRHDLPDGRVLISSGKSTRSSKCEIEATITMGPLDRNSVVEVSSIYLEMGMMGGVNAVTIIGKTKFTGSSVSRRFAAAAGW